MCGIAGFWRAGAALDAACLRRMPSTIAHRGPDDAGVIYAYRLVREAGSETGVIGWVGLRVFFVMFIRAGRGLSDTPLAWLGVLAWLFPINTHTAIYSAYWSLLVGCGRFCRVDILAAHFEQANKQWMH